MPIHAIQQAKHADPTVAQVDSGHVTGHCQSPAQSAQKRGTEVPVVLDTYFGVFPVVSSAMQYNRMAFHNID